MQRVVGPLDSLLDRRSVRLFLLAAVGGVYLWAFLADGMNPGSSDPDERIGWWSWADQYRSMQAAEVLAEGRVTREIYTYPLGYSILGALFLDLWPGQPFLLPNLLLILVTAAAWWALCRRWVGPTATLLVGVVFISTHAALIRLTMVIPWNTLPTQAALVTGIWLIVARRGPATVFGLALLAAVSWWVRPADATAFAPLLVWSVLRLPDWRQRVLHGVGGVLILGSAMAAVGLLNQHVFGSWRSSYDESSKAIGFFSFSVPHKIYWLLLDGRPFFGETDAALLTRYPWLWLAPAGVVFWIRREGVAGAAGVAAMGLNALLYLGYNDFFPHSTFRFSLIHYVSWMWLPLAAAVAGAVAYGLRDRTARITWAATLLLVGVGSGLHLREVDLPVSVAPGQVLALPDEHPVAVRFPGAPIDAARAVDVDGRRLSEGPDFQLPYVETDCRLLLARAWRAGTLTIAPDGPAATVVPQVSGFRWSWAWPRPVPHPNHARADRLHY